MADGDPAPGDNRNTFSADYVARLQADLDKAKEDLRAAVAGHTQALTTARQEATAALAALRTEHTAALDTAKAAHTEALTTAQREGSEALATAQREGSEALTAAQTAATQRVVGFALRAEGATAGLLDMDALRLLDPAEVGKLTVDDAGAVAGAKPLIETMKKAKPFLFGQGSTSNPMPPPTQTPPAVKHARDMTDAEFAEANKRKAWRGANAA